MSKGEVKIYISKKISAGGPKVPSDIYNCSKCQEGLWIAKDSVDFALDETIIMCKDCAEKDIIKNKVKFSKFYLMKEGKPTPL